MDASAPYVPEMLAAAKDRVGLAKIAVLDAWLGHHDGRQVHGRGVAQHSDDLELGGCGKPEQPDVSPEAGSICPRAPEEPLGHIAALDVKSRSAHQGPIEQHVTEAELWDLDLGTLSSARRRWIEKHARGCSECAAALRALSEGDEPRPHAPDAPKPPPAVAPELLQAREEFKVLLFRDPRRAQLVVEPVKGLRIAAARVDAAWAGSPSPARAGASWEFDLGPAKAARGRKVELHVEIAGGAHIALELDL